MSVNVGIRCKSVTEEAVAKRPDPADHDNKWSHQPPEFHLFYLLLPSTLEEKKNS